MIRRPLLKLALGLGLAATYLAAPTAAQAAAQAPSGADPLQLKVYNAGPNSFHVNSVLVTGASEALLIDTGFTRADALRIAADVLDSGKTLKTVLISNADPDFYFGAEAIKSVFPQVQVVATAAVEAKIRAKLQDKLAFWVPKMGANAPVKPALPAVLNGTTLTVDGQAVELRGTTGPLAHRPYVWIPSARAIAGDLAVFGNLHVWTADTQQVAERAAWIAQLDEMAALKPAIVVPGHMAAGTAQDASAIAYTRAYLTRFESELAKAPNSAALIEAMKQAYPQAGLPIALDIGAKVNKGEMKW